MSCYIIQGFEHPEIIVSLKEEESPGTKPPRIPRDDCIKKYVYRRSLNRMTLNKPTLKNVCLKWVLTP